MLKSRFSSLPPAVLQHQIYSRLELEDIINFFSVTCNSKELNYAATLCLIEFFSRVDSDSLYRQMALCGSFTYEGLRLGPDIVDLPLIMSVICNKTMLSPLSSLDHKLAIAIFLNHITAIDPKKRNNIEPNPELSLTLLDQNKKKRYALLDAAISRLFQRVFDDNDDIQLATIESRTEIMRRLIEKLDEESTNRYLRAKILISFKYIMERFYQPISQINGENLFRKIIAILQEEYTDTSDDEMAFNQSDDNGADNVDAGIRLYEAALSTLSAIIPYLTSEQLCQDLAWVEDVLRFLHEAGVDADYLLALAVPAVVRELALVTRHAFADKKDAWIAQLLQYLRTPRLCEYNQEAILEVLTVLTMLLPHDLTLLHGVSENILGLLCKVVSCYEPIEPAYNLLSLLSIQGVNVTFSEACLRSDHEWIRAYKQESHDRFCLFQREFSALEEKARMAPRFSR